MSSENEPRLIILMRNDMQSLNPGKACAQASHATSLFERQSNFLYNTKNSKWISLIDEWRDNRHFGTTIVLGASESQINDIFSPSVKSYPNIFGQIVFDPTYPIRDGKTIHHLEVMTCGYLFGKKSDLEDLLKPYKLKLY